jgi:hypothetical protein
MKKPFSLILLSLFPILLLTVGISYCCRDTRHFHLKKITSPLPPQVEWEVPASPLSEEILSQPYGYMRGGSQSCCFVSADQKYVLKFFKIGHLVSKRWLNYLPNKRYEKLQKAFASYKLAYDHFREETALLALHLNPTHGLYGEITVVDRQQREHRIPLDRVPFIIQKKADLLSDKIAKGRETEKLCAAILEFTKMRCESYLSDGDGEIKNNYGFVGDQAVQFDPGRLYYDESMKDPSVRERELERVKGKLQEMIAHAEILKKKVFL